MNNFDHSEYYNITTFHYNFAFFAYYALFWCDKMLFIYIIIIIYINNHYSSLYNTFFRIFRPETQSVM